MVEGAGMPRYARELIVERKTKIKNEDGRYLIPPLQRFRGNDKEPADAAGIPLNTVFSGFCLKMP